MKHLFRTIIYLSVFALVIPACSDDEPKVVDEPKEAKLLTFGFHETDNEGVILKDFEGVIAETTVSVIMPKDIDKSKLRAYFTVSEGATVLVDGITQVNGGTANDFTAAVDYIISNGDTNNKYTVTISKEADYVWTMLSTFNGISPSFVVMKVNPVTGDPYVMMRTRTEDGNSAIMIKYSNNTWQYVGSSSGFSTGAIGSYFDFTFDSSGNPYVVYPDNTQTVSGSTTVQFFDGTLWKIKGEGITSAQVTYSAIGLMSDGNPMILNMYNRAVGAISRRELVVSTYSGSSWTTDQTIPGRIATQYGYLPVGKLVNGTLYWAVFNAGVSPQCYSVYSHKNGAWTTIADNMIEQGANNSNLREFRMVVDQNENIYIGVCDDAEANGTYKPRIKKYNSTTKNWSTIGVVDMDIDDSRHFDLAVSPFGIPFVIFRDATNYPTVVHIDSDTKTWTTPYHFAASEAEEVFIDFDLKTGVGYALYSLSSNGGLALYKYDLP